VTPTSLEPAAAVPSAAAVALMPLLTLKRHLDRFSRFCRAHKREQQTHIHRSRCSVCSNRPHLALAALGPKNPQVEIQTDAERINAELHLR